RPAESSETLPVGASPMPEAKVIPIDGRGDEPVPRRGAGAAGSTGPRRARRNRRAAGAEPAAPTPDVAVDPIVPDDLGETPAAPTDWEQRVAGAMAFVRRRITGDYPVDDFGFDAELTDSLVLPLLRPLYERYFRIEVRGMDNVPAEGG